ncbi:hypothetical protein CXB51_028699 [Gossypium anomalum]|uniref:Uncharacterized protein n=1 Tax=Gossypium anomalum TaxID=47600 RepID=A0A8J5XYD4_9ROSI|nr:hypothetical protein CXB51_028699 [Gossypium anomalum]
MSWLRRNFRGLDADSTKVEGLMRIRLGQFTRPIGEEHAMNFWIIGGILMRDKSQNLVHLRWLLKLVDFREVGQLIMGIVPSVIFTSSSELLIYISPRNKPSYVGLPNELRDIRLLLDQRSEAESVAAIGFQQSILVAPEDLDDVYLIDLRGRMGEISRYSMCNTSTYGTIGRNSYLLARPLSLWS